MVVLFILALWHVPAIIPPLTETVPVNGQKKRMEQGKILISFSVEWSKLKKIIAFL
jgi:hypothetical protein